MVLMKLGEVGHPQENNAYLLAKFELYKDCDVTKIIHLSLIAKMKGN